MPVARPPELVRPVALEPGACRQVAQRAAHTAFCWLLVAAAALAAEPETVAPPRKAPAQPPHPTKGADTSTKSNEERRTPARPPRVTKKEADDWAREELRDDPLLADELVSLPELRAALSAEATREMAIPRHFGRAQLTDAQRKEFLAEALGNDSPVVRRQAAEEIGSRRWLDDIVGPMLLGLARRDDPATRQAVVVALEFVPLEAQDAPEHYVQALLAALVANDERVRTAAMSQLRRWSAAAVPMLTEAIQSGDAALKRAAAEVLAEILRDEQARSVKPGEGAPQPTADVEPSVRFPWLDKKSGGGGGIPRDLDPAKSRSGELIEPTTSRALDEAPPDVVRVFFGTNRELLANTPDPRNRLYTLPWVLGLVLLVVYLRIRPRAPKAMPRNRALTLAMLSLAAVVGYWCVSDWNQAYRTASSGHVGAVFGPHRESSGLLRFGSCEISLPPTHVVGEVEQPLLGAEDESTHVVLRRTDLMEYESFMRAARAVLDRAGEGRRDCFVFVHGYNTSFEQAARRTAQIHYDLQFAGAPMFYSWPSRGGLRHYPSDRNEIQYSYRYLKEFLSGLIDRLSADRINVIAHSMGADALGRALVEMGDRGKVFNQIVLAAPDIDEGVFREQVAPAMARLAERRTMYCSSNDWALVASNVFNDGRRAGDASSGIFVIKESDTVDASGIDTTLLGHSYYGDCLPLLKDVELLFERNLPPQDRELDAVTLVDASYWRFRRPKSLTEAPSE